MNIEWNKLRAFNGNVKNGFEELVCQLARTEQKSNNSKFIRIAAPDGGVESYCILSDNSEYGWQAKFFSSLGKVQWAQLDKSFKTAFEKHPNLVKYYICTPLDREDPRIVITKGKRRGNRPNYFMDRWNDKVAEWKSYAKLKGRDIEFEYWGNFELFERLGKRENEGKLYYWFGQEEFSDEWFNHRLQESIRNLDKRYTPELNLDLPIAKIFEGLARDKHFNRQFISYLDDLLKRYGKAISHVNEPTVKDLVDKISSLITQFKQECEQIDFVEITIIDTDKLTSLLEEVRQLIESLIHQFYELNLAPKKEEKTKNEHPSERNNYGWDIEYFRAFSSSIYKFVNFLKNATVLLSNNPFMVLTGEAGIGKSHLLADIAIKRRERNQSSILLLGQHFTTEEPWSQIKKLLQLNCDRDVFLSALNAKAETCASRILILIDAINEGEGKKLWKNHIAGFVAAVKKFPNLALVFSIRTSYENLLIPDSLKENKEVIKIVHNGFANNEYEASKFFFENFGIKQPSIPLLHPEFSNPLFLKLFCEGLYKKGLHEIPDGHEGISTIINFYLESINSKISEKHNLPTNLNLIQKVVKQIASQIADEEASYIKFDKAFSLVTVIAKKNSIIDQSQFFQDLISEGLLTQNLYWTKDKNHFDGVYISYERFSDHLVCSYLLENYFDKNNPNDSFKVGSRLHKVIENQKTIYFNRGVIEALSIQLPEIAGVELFEVATHASEFQAIAYSFIDSIIWRKKETIHDKLRKYINEIVIRKLGLYDYFINTILLVTSHSDHYFNSDFLHRYLMRFSMANRDSWWTKFIHNQYPGYSDQISSIRRMIDWAWTDDKRENISDESIRLMCQTMFWFLTSTNRTLRDSATKAIICLLEERINVLIELIKIFEKVNDRYVLQRLYAVAYGCAVRTSNVQSIKELGEYIFQTIFNSENVIPDILLRDYARGIIEIAAIKGHEFSFQMSRIRPPFKSVLPNKFPSKEDVKKYEYDYEAEGFKDYYWSLNSIISSMKTNTGGQMYGDFGRYVFESAFRDWKVNSQLLSNLAVKWIIEEYGYDIEKHGEFDRRIKSQNHNRHYVMEERIGKKYQWIAFYDLLARVSDNFTCYENSYSITSKTKSYDGPWDPYVRDIDPTITIKEKKENKFEKFWWNSIDYDNWSIPNKDWVFKTDDLPNPLQMISVFDDTGKEWLVLEILTSWSEPADIGKDKWENPHKDLWYQIRSYITKKTEYNKILKWAKEKNFMGRWMPESGTRYELFSREYYWSPACETFRKQGYREYTWSKINDQETGKFVGSVAVTAVNYLWEEQFDASKESPISFYKPTEIIFNMLDLQYSKIEGQLLNRDEQMICFDPSSIYPTHSCLLVRKNDFLKKLEENDLNIFWTILGEKLILGEHFNKSDHVGRLNISGIIHFDKKQLKHIPYFVEE